MALWSGNENENVARVEIPFQVECPTAPNATGMSPRRSEGLRSAGVLAGETSFGVEARVTWT
jgi:hypothetical protein